MKSTVSKSLIFSIACLLLAAIPQSAHACTVCFGDPESNVVQGAAWAIIFLGAVVMSVLGCVGGFFIFIAKRAASAGTDSTEENANKA